MVTTFHPSAFGESYTYQEEGVCFSTHVEGHGMLRNDVLTRRGNLAGLPVHGG